jgi:hypothetical protein
VLRRPIETTAFTRSWPSGSGLGLPDKIIELFHEACSDKSNAVLGVLPSWDLCSNSGYIAYSPLWAPNNRRRWVYVVLVPLGIRNRLADCLRMVRPENTVVWCSGKSTPSVVVPHRRLVRRRAVIPLGVGMPARHLSFLVRRPKLCWKAGLPFAISVVRLRLPALSTRDTFGLEGKQMLLSSQSTAALNMHSANLISRSHWLLVAALSATLVSSSCSRSQQSALASSGSRAGTEVAPPFSAEMWLQWDKPSRIAFVLGNIRGHWNGVMDGCGDAQRAVRSLPSISGFTPAVADEMYLDCGKYYKPSNRTIESYEEVVTNLYNRYPEDRIIDIPDVLRLLEGDSKLTAEDIQKRIKITQNPKR